MDVGTAAVLAHSWLLLIHQLPAKPAYLRVKIWRRLQDIGAIPVKNAVHVLPMNEEITHNQQIVADRFRSLGLIPIDIKVSDEVWRASA